ncbi:MAG: hypothetical protein MUC41_13190, partial [Syntrophobacteraceae bacterium]|nr:hypothetical protein [Syntrophobacteraceae bacterium]
INILPHLRVCQRGHRLVEIAALERERYLTHFRFRQTQSKAASQRGYREGAACRISDNCLHLR